MRTFAPTTLLVGILSTLTATRANTVAWRDRAFVWSNHGTTHAPASGRAIRPGDSFPFAYREANMCKNDAVTVSAYLSRNPPTQATVMPSGQLAPGSFDYHFGDWTVSNWGLPSNNPPPATLVMPVVDGAQPGTPMWFTVLENYANCPPHGQSNWFGLATTQVFTPAHDVLNNVLRNRPEAPLRRRGIDGTLPQHKNFWFEDGNVVIVAQNTGFKVYKGLLAAQSPVFQDLFASANHAEEVFEGCPVVRLSDFPEDLRYLLPFLLPTTHVRIPTDINMASEAEYNQLSALLLLGDKYQLESITHQAADCFKAAFTNDFDRWDARPEADGLHARAGSEPTTGAADHRLRAIDAVHLARITDASSVLPLALYHCALLGDAAADGWTRADGRVHRLSAADLKRCEDGHRYLCEQRAGFLVGLFKADPSPECRTRIICGGLLEYLHGKGAAVYEATPALLDRPDGWTYRSALCMRCARELEEREKGARRELWKKLPEIFRLKEAEMKVWEA